MPEPDAWNTEDFENLSDKIFDKTGVRLSVSTLKRIWGRVNYNSSPSLSTLNTLARFLDYGNWRDFEQKNADDSPASPASGASAQHSSLTADLSGHLPHQSAAPAKNPSDEFPPPATPKNNPGKSRFLAPVLLGTTILLVAGFLLSGSFRSGQKQAPAGSASPDSLSNTVSGSGNTGSPEAGPKNPSEKAVFQSRKTSDDLPNSVVFDYDASGFGGDSVFIQQSWDPARREKVPVTGRQHTSLYYYPGYFNARLIVNGQEQGQAPIFIQTKGWKGIIEAKPVPVYLTPAEIKMGGSLGVNRTILRQKTGSSVFAGTWVDFTNIRPFEGLDAAHFMMETSVRNTSTVEESPCRRVRITVVGKESAIIIPLSAKGCIADLQLLTGDRMIFGKDHDLSAFGCDFHYFQRVTCKVETGHLQISLNGTRILDTPQEKTIGDIVGVSIAFEGSGEIKNISLGLPGKPVYQENF